jgi:hypothetical protein
VAALQQGMVAGSAMLCYTLLEQQPPSLQLHAHA